jgi:hypothetical protein
VTEPAARHATLTAWEPPRPWTPAEPLAYADVHVPGAGSARYATRQWESPVVASAFPARELVPSWNARTPQGTWLLVEGRVGDGSGWTPWLAFARWVEGDPGTGAPITRTSVPGQRLEAGRVATDTYVAAPARPFDRWQLRLTACAPPGTDPRDDPAWPEVSLVGGACSAMAIAPTEPTSRYSLEGAHEIPVPPHSQRLHVDTFPEWEGGGRSWCSPTSATMLLEHWGVAPTGAEVAWVGHHTDPQVVHAVRQVFDRAYGGAGNWPFNTAYAATRGLRAYVTRLRDLTEAERFVAAGLPLVVSVAFGEGELDGAGYATDGHLLTIVGFTAAGDVVSNDPNSHRLASNDAVRTVYRRDQFERVWLRGDGGLAYVVHPRHIALPAPPVEANWG